MRNLIAVFAAALLSTGCFPSLSTDGFVDEYWLQLRQLEWLHFATEGGIQTGSIPNVMAHLEREAREPDYSVAPGSVPDDAWDGVFDKVWRLRDTSDFDVLRMLDMLYAFEDHPVASATLWQKLRDAVFTFKFWYSDPTPPRIVNGDQVVDDMWYWTENHILIFKTCEYLAGQRYPNQVFAVTGLTGAEHQARARDDILTWLDERSRYGFSEWHSNVYYNLDMRPLLSLVEWSDDPVIVKRASMVLDLVMMDTASHLHRGTFGATHGRSYIKDKASATTEDTFNQSKMLFDDTDEAYRGTGSASGLVFARAKRYRLPEVIRRIARYDEPMIDRQRMNLPIDEVPPDDPFTAPPPVAPFGLDYQDEANLPFWWAMNAQTVWQLLPLTFEVATRENLWPAQFSPFQDLLVLVGDPADPQAVLLAQFFAKMLWPSINSALLKEVNTYTYRTKHYMLSTAQDYRKGVRGSQTHTWQATLGEQAIVFTQHPSYLPVSPGDPVPSDWNWQREDEPGPGYWTGEASQPRAAQHENVAIAIYSIQYAALPDLGPALNETHAYFPHAHLDEVVQEGKWTFGRKDDAYVALYSHRDTEWRGGQPEVFENGGLDFDLVAPGSSDNVWIVECGSLDEWPGGFAAFRQAIAAADVEVTPSADAFDVVYVSPTRGEMSLGWEGPLVVDGADQALADYPRIDNPFVQVPFLERRYDVSDGEYELLLDFEQDLREVSAPASNSRARRLRFKELWLALRGALGDTQ